MASPILDLVQATGRGPIPRATGGRPEDPTPLAAEVVAVMAPGVTRFRNGQLWVKHSDGTVEFIATSAKEAEAPNAHAPLELLPTPTPAPLPMLAPAPTMFDLEQHLESLTDTEDLVPEEQDEEFRRELAEALEKTIAKRDRIGQFIAHAESQAALAKAEKDRLARRQKFYESLAARMETYVSMVIVSLGKDAKDKWKKLEGNTVTFALRGCVQSVEVMNESAVPDKYKLVDVSLPAETWQAILDALELELLCRVEQELKKNPVVTVRLSMVKDDLDAGIEVPGVKLAGGTYLKRS